jgi:hypothetical protein
MASLSVSVFHRRGFIGWFQGSLGRCKFNIVQSLTKVVSMAKFLRVLSTYYDNREFRIKEPMGGMQKYRKAAEKV